LRSFDDLKRIGRSHEHLAEQRIGIKRNRRNQTLKLGRRPKGSGLIYLRRLIERRLIHLNGWNLREKDAPGRGE